MLNIKNDLILNENFWQKYCLISDYNTLNIRITNDNRKYFFFNINFNRSHLRILENQSSLIMKFKRRVFKRCVQKSAQFYLYVVHKVEKDTEITQKFKKDNIISSNY